MRQYTIIVLLAACILGCAKNMHQTDSAANDETRAFMAQLLSDFKEPPYVLASSTGSALSECAVFDPLLFTPEEIVYLQHRLQGDRHLNWRTGELPGAVLLANNSRNRRRLKELYAGQKNVCIFSHPIFLRNAQYCVIYEEVRWGPSFGQGTLWCYQKQSGKWQQKEQLCDWIN